MVMRLSAWDELNQVAFETSRVDLIAVDDPQWGCAVAGVRGAASSPNNLGFPLLDTGAAGVPCIAVRLALG
jgi:hypothetical protein